MQRIKSKSERILQLIHEIEMLKKQNEILEFTKWRWYETYWDYQFRIRNIPSSFFPMALNSGESHFSEADLLDLIERARIENIKELASIGFLNSVCNETISPEEIAFDIRRGKHYKQGWRKIRLGKEQLEHLFYNTDWCYSGEFEKINAN